jgi:NADP-dependent 3-hydroxy acid dehydrogenase YdfG
MYWSANAGGGRGRPIDTKASTLDPALLQLATEMNLFGTVYTVNAVAPTMKQQRSGKIITVASSPAPPRRATVAMPIMGQRKLLSPITRGISRRT